MALVESRANARPDQIAYTSLASGETPAEQITYGELHARAMAIARMLREPARKGDRVAIAVLDSFEFLPAFLGCLYAGVVAVPVEMPRSPRNLPRFLAICDDALPAVLLTSRASLSLAGMRLEESDIVRNAKLLRIDDAAAGEYAPNPASLAYLQYTSGSTATPKGVMITHANALANLAFIDDGFRHDARTIGLSWLPHYHDMGLVYGLLQPLYNGFHGYLMPAAAFVQRPSRWLEAITRFGVTHTGGPNFAYDLCVRKTSAEQRAAYDLRSWRVAYNGAEPVRPATLRAFADAFTPCGFSSDALCPSYGLAEATLKVTSRRPGEALVVALADGRELAGCGQIEADADVAIVSPETGAEAAEGDSGEIFVSGPGVAQGYWERSAESSGTFHARIDGDARQWLRTGDLGFVRDGELYVEGRIKDLIIIRGRNLYPQDIEATVERAHPNVRPAAVAAFGLDSSDGERLAIAVEFDRGAEPAQTITAIRDAVSQTHEAQAHTVILLRAGTLPKTSSGKVQRRLTRHRFLDGALDVIAVDSMPVTDQPRALFDRAQPLQYLRHLTAELLGVEIDSVSADTTLTSLAIDSLQALELKNRIEADAGVLVEPSAILEGQTLSDLAKHFDGAAQVEPIPKRGLRRAPASIEQERLWYLDRVRPGNLAHHVPAVVRFKGELNRERLKAAGREVILKHEILRTLLTSEDGRPVQLIQPDAPGEWFHDSLTLEAALTQPFDLAGGPLFRLCVAGDLLAAVFHHAIADISSAAIFLREIARAYQGASLGDLPIQFADFAVWQREQLESGSMAADEQYWRNQLDSMPAIEWRKAETPGPGSIEFSMGDDVVAAVRMYAGERSITVFSVMLAAWKLLLFRYTGQEDLVIGTPAANRTRRELEPMIGFFAYPLLLRTRVTADTPFEELARRIHEITAEAIDHSGYPFAGIAEFAPGLQVLFSVVDEMSTLFKLGDVDIKPAALPSLPTDFDVFMTVAGGNRGMLAYRPELFSNETAAALARSYPDILSAAVSGRGFALPQVLETQARWMRPRHNRLNIAIASTFTAEPLEEPLAFWMEQLGLPARIRFAPYGQIFQSILDVSGVLSRNNSGLNLLLIRPSDWPKPAESLAELAAVLEKSVTAGAVWVVCLLEEGIPFPGVTGVSVLTAAQIGEWYPVTRIQDQYAESLGQVPFTEEYFAAIAASVARRFHALRQPPRKVIALDCDNTLWQGVCAEDGPLGVEPNIELQRMLVEKREAGFLLCLCSKNVEDDVWAVFDARTEMPLRREHLAGWRLNWEAKSANIESLAGEFNLGIDSFVLVEDNPIECAEVSGELPGILCALLPRDAAEAVKFLEHYWPLDVVSTTPEDRARALMYRQEAERRNLERSSQTLEEFLAGLELRVDISPAIPADFERLAQLTQRTNQFNTTTIRRTTAELAGQGLECMVTRVSDRFGDYGLVGAMMFRADSGVLRVESLLMSCRALGRGVEYQMLRRLGAIAQERNLANVVIPFLSSSRNRPARDFLEAVANREDGCYTIGSAEAVSVAAARQSSTPAQAVRSHRTEAAPEFQPDWQAIASHLRTPSNVQAMIRATSPARRVSEKAYVAPRTPLERTLAEIWADVLRLPRVSVEADFFELGGHSLLAVQVLSRTRDRLQTNLSLDVVFGGAFTISEMAKAIELHEIEAAGAGAEELLAELEGLSDEEVQRLLNEDA